MDPIPSIAKLQSTLIEMETPIRLPIQQDRKRRTTQACASCNVRKIRCDMTDLGHPCTACRIGQYSCEARARKTRRKNGDMGQRNTQTKAAEEGTSDQQPNSGTLNPLHWSGTGSAQSPTYAKVRSGLPQGPEILRRTSELSPKKVLEHALHHNFLADFARPFTDTHANEQPPELPINDQAASGCVQESSKISEDMLFLKKKGAINLPERNVMDRLVFHYFRFIHPFFPIIDKTNFLSSYEQMNSYRGQVSSGLSLLLLQAVLFSASAGVPLSLLKDAGYSSRKEARDSLYKKTKYLYHFDYEPDVTVTIQSLLLMSHYYPSVVDQKHTWHWAHQAITLAQAIGLHRRSGDTPPNRLTARIWSACLVRDRLISLGTGRPMHINSLDCDLPILTSSDLEEPGDDTQESEVKAMFIELVKLCRYMEGVLCLRCSASVDNNATPEQIQTCEDALQSWLENLPAAARRQEEPVLTAGCPNIATLYRAVLRQVYNVTIIALHQPHHVLSVHKIESQQQSEEGVKLAASDTTILVTQLVESDLVKYCPTYCVTCVLPALIIHLSEARASTNSAMKELHKSQYDLCMIFLRELGEIYWHASFYFDLFELASSTDSGVHQQRHSRTRDPLILLLQQRIELRRKTVAADEEVGEKQSWMQVQQISNTSFPNIRQRIQGRYSPVHFPTPLSDVGSSEHLTESTSAATAPENNGASNAVPAWMGPDMHGFTSQEDLQIEGWMGSYIFQTIFPST